MDQKLISDIQGAEGCKLTAYKDTRGYWTIGWGHLLNQSLDWTGHTITQEQADAYLQNDISIAANQASNLREWKSLDTDCRQNAVIELVFNMGIAKWIGFQKCRSFIQVQDWLDAHNELLNSIWSGQVGPTRANRLANYLKNGQYP